MKNKAAFGTMLTLLTMSILTLAVKIPSVEAEPKTIIVPDEYSSIQEAIDSASEGDVVFVKSGIYSEHFVVDKTISLIGENKDTTIISGSGLQLWYTHAPPWWGLVTILSANNVTISGFTIQDWDTGPRYGIGIAIRRSNYCNISDNLFINLDTAIRLLENSMMNLLTGNLFLNGGGTSIEEGSSFNTLENNEFINSSLYVAFGSNPFQNIDSSNVINGKPVYYWVNQYDKQVPSDAGYIVIVNSTRITIKDVNIDFGIGLFNTTNSTIQNVVTTTRGFITQGFFLINSHGNTIRYCTLRNTTEAIRLERSNHNSIIGNTISYHSDDGISFYSSNENMIVNNTVTIDRKYSSSFLISGGSNNLIYHNNIIHRYDRGIFLLSSGFNFWDNGVEGNFWSYYNGTDANGDGIGDTPYTIDALNKDNYPLMSLLPEAPDPIPPVANAGESQIAPEFEIVEFDGSDSYDNVGIKSYEWDFGDGTSGTGIKTSHIYNQTYSTITRYTVTLTVKDDKGHSDSASTIVSILNDSNKDGIPDLSDSDSDGMPNIWETKYGLDPYDPTDATGDQDGDLLLNIEEYHLGTDPHAFNISWKNMVFFLTFCLSVAIVASIWLLYRQRTLIKQQRESGKTP